MGPFPMDGHIYIYIFIYIRLTVPYVRRALNLLRVSFSPIFQYFSAVNVTRVSFSPVFQYFVSYVLLECLALWGEVADSTEARSQSLNPPYLLSTATQTR